MSNSSFKRTILTTISSTRLQHELEVSTKQAIFVDSNISDTIQTQRNHQDAMRLRVEFKEEMVLA
ncbi:NADPH--cytochrome P450 reductase-like [Iris pallida]|uniref:NADPH--cytochrome P450 reductase-like n=1 Tax=Iris pallida TaxID=29817 RepID=A0AAX6F7R7_IRIPA|nr:NADPH--cytochrome P450 reductase-like [Iris pallida]